MRELLSGDDLQMKRRSASERRCELVFEMSRPGLLVETQDSHVSATAWKNGFLEVDVDVTFTYQEDLSIKLTLPAFWDGKDASGHDRFSVRFAPTRIGDWSYRAASRQDPSLDGLTGAAGQPEIIRCQPSSHPGFLERTDKYHWKYSNGARFFPVGTTAYDWIGGQCAEGPALDYFIEFLKDGLTFEQLRERT